MRVPWPFRGCSQALEWPEVERALADRDQACARLMRSEGVPAAQHADPPLRRCLLRRAVLPPRNSASEPTPPTRSTTLYRDFLAAHDRIYGHSTEVAARIVNIRRPKSRVLELAAIGGSL